MRKSSSRKHLKLGSYCTNWSLWGNRPFSHLTFWNRWPLSPLQQYPGFLHFLTAFPDGMVFCSPSSRGQKAPPRFPCLSSSSVLPEQRKRGFRGWGQSVSSCWCAVFVVFAYFPKKEKETDGIFEWGKWGQVRVYMRKGRKDWEGWLRQRTATKWSQEGPHDDGKGLLKQAFYTLSRAPVALQWRIHLQCIRP